MFCEDYYNEEDGGSSAMTVAEGIGAIGWLDPAALAKVLNQNGGTDA